MCVVGGWLFVCLRVLLGLVCFIVLVCLDVF